MPFERNSVVERLYTRQGRSSVLVFDGRDNGGRALHTWSRRKLPALQGFRRLAVQAPPAKC
jgi:hypothetical protein